MDTVAEKQGKGKGTAMYQPEGYQIETEENQKILRSVSLLREAYYYGSVLEGRALLCDSAHNLHVDLGCMRGVIPRCEGAIGIDDGSVRDIALISRVNKPVSFRITGFRTDNCGETYAMLSRKSVQLSCRQDYLSLLLPGDIIDACVTHLECFGAFCDVGAGISALLPIDCISVSRIPHPSARFTPGQRIKAVVKCLDAQGRLTLSHKELLGSWEQNIGELQIGDTVPGVIRSVEPYGIFVELKPNLAGLAECSNGISPGAHASVYIKNIIPERMKIKLIIVDAFFAEYPLQPLTYYIDSGHIDRWLYSPTTSEKSVESQF